MQEQEINVLNEQSERDVSLSSEQAERNITISGESINVTTNKDYEALNNKPQINSVILIGNKSSGDLHLQEEGDYANQRITNSELEEIFDW